MKKIIGFVLICLLLGTLVFGEETSESSDWKFSIAGLRVLWYGITPTGGDVSFTYSGLEFVNDLNTYLFLKFGGGYEERDFFHNADGSVLMDTSTIYDDEEMKYLYKRRMADFQWEAALYQGITWNERTDDNLLEGFLYYRGRYDNYNYNAPAYTVTPYLFAAESPFTDNEGLFGNSLMIGACWKDLTEDSHQVQKGIYGEVSAEYGPSWFANSIFGNTDYYRLNFQVKGFLPLFDLDPASEKNKLAIYLGDFASVDYAGGDSIPIYVMQSFGGKKLRKGLGGSVRGFESFAWDTTFKAVNNLELRVNGPALGNAKLIPTLFTYFDAGYYSAYQIAPGTYDTSADSAGFLCSAGTGLVLNVFGIERVRMSFDFPLYGQRKDGNTWNLYLDFGFHF